MNINGFGKVTEDEINTFEKEFDFPIPEDYRNFLKDYNGGTPMESENRIALEGAKEGMVLDVLFGIGNSIEEDFRISTWIEEFTGEIPKTVLPIGTDVGGGIILLSSSEKKKGVYFWDFEFCLKSSNEYQCLYKVADTFTEFIGKINE